MKFDQIQTLFLYKSEQESGPFFDPWIALGVVNFEVGCLEHYWELEAQLYTGARSGFAPAIPQLFGRLLSRRADWIDWFCGGPG